MHFSGSFKRFSWIGSSLFFVPQKIDCHLAHNKKFCDGIEKALTMGDDSEMSTEPFLKLPVVDCDCQFSIGQIISVMAHTVEGQPSEYSNASGKITNIFYTDTCIYEIEMTRANKKICLREELIRHKIDNTFDDSAESEEEDEYAYYQNDDDLDREIEETEEFRTKMREDSGEGFYLMPNYHERKKEVIEKIRKANSEILSE